MEGIVGKNFVSGFLTTATHSFEKGMISIFTPSFADEANTNAQNLSVKEIVARLPPDRFAVTMLYEGPADQRIAARPNTRLLAWEKSGNTLRTFCRILTRIPDIYFFPREGPLDAAFLSFRRYTRVRTAVVTHVVSGGLYREPYSRSRMRNICEADRVFANNAYLAELVSEKMGVSAGTIHNGIDRRYFYPPASSRRETNTPTVLYAGSLRAYKRVPLVVRAAAQWRDAQFRVAGRGEDEEACKTLASQLDCTNIVFLGHLSLDQLGKEMRRADVFFFPSITEGHPQVLGQAAACGLPSIAMRIYRPDYVMDRVTGFLADSDDELSTHLGTLIRNSELRRSMGQAGIAHARKFDWEEIAQRWQEVFEDTARSRRKN